MKRVMNKKGFTLVELLAVVVIIGLLLGVAYPAISRYIGEAKDSAYDLHEADMKTAASNFMVECVKNGEECAPAPGRSKKVTLKDLVENDYTEKLRDPEDPDNFCDTEKSYVIIKNEKGSTTNLDYDVCLVCGGYESDICESAKGDATNCDKENDTKPPVCGKVTGESTLWTNGDRVISVTCSDDNCGCKQDTYYKKFTSSETKGAITIEDEAGNKTDCPVNTYIDKDKPTCELEVVGTLGQNDWYGGTNVKVRFKNKADGLSGLNTYGMGTSSKNPNFDKAEEYIVKPGITTVYGYVKDNAGNVGTCSVEVKYDDAKPTITYVRYGIQVYEKEDIASVKNNTIELNSFTGEYGMVHGAMVYLKSGNPGTTMKVMNGATELATRTISAGVTSMEFKFDKAETYTNLRIELGNLPVNQIERIELLTETANTTGYYTNKDVTAYITGHDSLSGIYKYSFDGGKTWQDENQKTFSQNQDISPAIQDIATNVSTPQPTKINNIDKVKPNCTITLSGTPGKNGWYTSNVTVTLNKEDAAATNIYAMSGTRNFGVVTSNTLTYDQLDYKVQLDDTTSTTWYGFVRDKAGNTNTCNVVVKKDTVVPTCSISPTGTTGNQGWYRSNVNLSLTTNDVTSGVDGYDLTGSSSASYGKTTSMTLSSDTNGTNYYGYVVDNAGLTGTCQLLGVKKDSTYPTCSVSGGSSNWSYSDVTITGTCYDSMSGCAGNTSSTISSEGSSYYSPGSVSDIAGNVTTCGTVQVMIDKCVSTHPSCGSYGTCSATCGGGTQSRTCGAIGVSGRVCGTYQNSQSCNTQACPKPDKPAPDTGEKDPEPTNPGGGNTGGGGSGGTKPTEPDPNEQGGGDSSGGSGYTCKDVNDASGDSSGSVPGNTGGDVHNRTPWDCSAGCSVNDGTERLCPEDDPRCEACPGCTMGWYNDNMGCDNSKYWCSCD